MKRYFLGIDNGGTVAKAALFDEMGTEIAVNSRRTPFSTPYPGWAERDMDEMWSVNCELIRELIATAKIPASAIGGVACTGHGKGLYLWGKDDKPAWKGILSTDARASKYPAKWEKSGAADRIFKKTCQKILACQPVSLLAWFLENEPEVISRTRWIFEAKDYVRFRLTGEAFAEVTDYSGSGLMNLAEKRFDRELLAEYGLETVFDKLPPLVTSIDRCGKVSASASRATGLVEGTPVAGGMFDIDACAVASGVVDESLICMVAGTWSINEYLSRKPVTDKSVMMNSLFCLPEYYLIEESSPTSAGNYEWFTGLFLDAERREAESKGISLYDYAENLASGVRPEECDLVFLPFLFGSNYNPEARACFAGFSARHTRAHMIRAVMEGVAFSHKTHMEKLLSARGSPATVRMTGGAARSAEWVRIFANVLELPIETVHAEEPGALGCAMAASVAAGAYASLAEAARVMGSPGRRVVPDPSAFAAYRKKYALYRKIADSLDGTWGGF